jgi:hypothetical protein
VVAFWVYDKRAVDGCDFAYFGLRLFQSDDGVRGMLCWLLLLWLLLLAVV